MSKGIKAAYSEICNHYGLEMIPVGDAFELARRELGFARDPEFDYTSPTPGALPREPGSLNVGWQWITGNTLDGNAEFVLDAAHCSDLGLFLAAAVWFEKLTGKSADDCLYRLPSVAGRVDQILRKAAHQAVT